MLEEKLMADICRNWVYCFCFVALIDVAMRKNDWEASEGGREDGGEGGGYDMLNHPPPQSPLPLVLFAERRKSMNRNKAEARSEERGQGGSAEEGA